MTGTEPQEPGDPAPAGSLWWWALATIVVVGVLLLVVQPWSPHETEPVLPTSAAPATTPAPTASSDLPSASPTPSPSPTPPPVPGADAVFDDTTQKQLFVRPKDLVAAVPAAKDGVDVQIRSGELPWGLPEGSTVNPARCTTAVTVVPTPPDGFDARGWGNDAMQYVQTITRLPDAAAAQAAFRDLVVTLDGCPEYEQVNPGIDGASWTAEPAIEGQGVYPSVVVQLLHSAEGQRTPQYEGHLLVGNVIVTWTASATGAGPDEDLDVPGELATLGTPESLSQLAQDRAQQAVAALG